MVPITVGTVNLLFDIPLTVVPGDNTHIFTGILIIRLSGWIGMAMIVIITGLNSISWKAVKTSTSASVVMAVVIPMPPVPTP